jgi:prolyl-tRNA synthetase
VEVLYDDRDESPGVKFTDADLIGLPLRLTVAERGLKQGAAELKRRDRTEKDMIPLENVIEKIQDEIHALEAEIQSKVAVVPYLE